MFVLPLLALLLPLSTYTIPIPNRLIGSPEVNCGEDQIDLLWTTENPFGGRVFAIGHADDADCFIEAEQPPTTRVSISIPKNKCGVTNTTVPDQGLYVNFRIMVSFHKNFITKVDRAFEVSCFYMETEKTVTFPITVSMKELEGVTFNGEMPVCQYEVLDAETELPATVVSVGDALLHRWSCASNAPSLWCMKVHSCTVGDGQGVQAVILDEFGCENDPFLLRNLNYTQVSSANPSAHLVVQQEAHAFKFADRVVVNFQCSIMLDIQRDGQCPFPTNAAGEPCEDIPISSTGTRTSRRFARDAGQLASIEEIPPVQELVVRSRNIEVIDPAADLGLTPNDQTFRQSMHRIKHGIMASDCFVDRNVFYLVICALLFISFISALCAVRYRTLLIASVKK